MFPFKVLVVSFIYQVSLSLLWQTRMCEMAELRILIILYICHSPSDSCNGDILIYK